MANILVVDDERGVAKVLKRLLQRDGHVVEVAWDGHEALDFTKPWSDTHLMATIRELLTRAAARSDQED